MPGRALAWNVWRAQAITAVVGAMIAWSAGGRAASAAALYGGIVAIAPAVYFATRVLLRERDAAAVDVLAAFYRAEAGKLLLTALLFWIGTLYFGAHYAALILTCAACLAMNWMALALTRAH